MWCVCVFRHIYILYIHTHTHIFICVYLLYLMCVCVQGIPKGTYHCTIDLLFDWFGLVCFGNKNINCQLSYSWFQASQTGSGGKWYNDTSPFSIPWCVLCMISQKFWIFVVEWHSQDKALTTLDVLLPIEKRPSLFIPGLVQIFMAALIID